MGVTTKLVILLCFIVLAHCGYPPTGDEVIPGSVLLPATRRGRYLANIVRRQAVDGTGIKFNKDADRMNAEAKKKVDVLSEELLPYIIAEQDRRVTLHSRIMTAIQNGEKGITIAEMRNKSPLLIRKGNLYRCPPNRAPIEPDGSGTMMCEDNILPTQIIYDSCLSAEDRPLYYTTVNGVNRYFFCDRQRVEGADLPHTNNGTVVACHPSVRTSLNYTMQKCALEDTDDVVVHFRYYPDRTYKYVTELDPDREMCDHWNPCQIGYIFSLPMMDQGKKAEEFYPNYDEMWPEFERDESVDQDSKDEGVNPALKTYKTSPRKIKIPEGYTYEGVRFKDSNGQWKKLAASHVEVRTERPHFGVRQAAPNVIWLIIDFPKWKSFFYGQYYVVCRKEKKEKLIHFLNMIQASTYVVAKVVEVIISQKRNLTRIPFVCNHCQVESIMIRCEDDQVYNFNMSRYRIEDHSRPGKPQEQFVIDLSNMLQHEVGYYFALIKNGDGFEERVMILEVQDKNNVVNVARLNLELDVGGHYDHSINYECQNCKATEVLCNGYSATAAGRVFINPSRHEVNFNFPSFVDSNACVYVGFFRVKGNNMLFKILAVVDNNSVKIPEKLVIPPPKDGEQFQEVISYVCQSCKVLKVFVNGLEIMKDPKPPHQEGGLATYETTSSTIVIRIVEFGSAYEGVYQAVFDAKGERVTKTIMEIKEPGETRRRLIETTTIALPEPSTEIVESSPVTESAPHAESDHVAGSDHSPESDHTVGVDHIPESDHTAGSDHNAGGEHNTEGEHAVPTTAKPKEDAVVEE